MPPSECLRGSQLYPRTVTVPHDRDLQRDGGDEQSGVTDEQAGAALGGVQIKHGTAPAQHQHRAVAGRKRRAAEIACARTADEAISGGPL